MAAGSWDLTLTKETPKLIRDQLDFFGHVFVFDASHIRPGITDAAMIAMARWAGIVRRRETPFKLSGPNMTAWLGDEDGKGPVLEATVGATGTPFATYLAALLAICPAVAAGTATAVAGAKNTVYPIGITVRAALDNLCALFGAEYRVNKDATVDTAPVGSSAIYVQTPAVAVMARSSGRDQAVVGIHVTQLDVAVDAEEYFVRSAVQAATGAWSFAAGAATPYKDLFGNLVKMTKVGVAAGAVNPATPTDAAALAASYAGAGEVLRQGVQLAADDFSITRFAKVGDWLWVYDPQSNTFDTTGPGIRYRGEVLFPMKLRLLALTWPVERGMSVWYRDRNANWIDLTNWVIFDGPGARFEVGASTRALLTKP